MRSGPAARGRRGTVPVAGARLATASAAARRADAEFQRIDEVHRAVMRIREEIRLAAGEANRVGRDETAARRVRAAVLSRQAKDPSAAGCNAART
jgi:hypothetical protein